MWLILLDWCAFNSVVVIGSLWFEVFGCDLLVVIA